MTRRPAPMGAQRGAALLTAMIIVTLITTLAAGMVWQQWVAVQVEAAERSQAQARWILNGALDWARLILREDQRTSDVDHLGEPWAVPLAEAKLSTFLAADRNNNADEAGAPEAYLSGVIRDVQARYNLRNLVREGKVQPEELKTLMRLCELIGLPPSVAPLIADSLRQAMPGTTVELNGIDDSRRRTPLLPASVDDLGWLGLTPATVQRLAPFVAWLPANTPVNLNTAPREVIVAVVAGVDLAGAERLVQARLRKHLQQVEDAREVLGPGAALDSQRLGVNSRYFEVDGTMRLDTLVVSQRSLLERNPQSRDVRVLMSRRIDPATVRTSLQQ
ncbi:type II secretion system minor pseudopilin GspK [Leptothrix discophora]|uniref:Type II secretion system protein K n=1 Tax=Leptothrix discophora TaxID=89 RepID=A0ABT9G5Z6_LEPDI|nr:type II secretion system minor pseudopilin GspK [Leptothrix discophora]MDP4301914.1 type II secretion system minor pseudopilin GspK [Leptothrix discophora]